MKAIGKLKNTVKYIKECHTVTAKGITPELIPLASDINEHGYIEIKNKDFVYANRSIFCMGAYSTFTTTDGDIKDVPVMVNDDYFEILSDNAKDFIRCHELGHFSRHLEKIKLMGSLYRRNITDEYEADEFASQFIGKENTIKALEELKQVTYITSTNNELNKRIENIKKK